MRIMGGIGDEDFLHTGDLRCGLRNRGTLASGNKEVDVAANLRRGGDRVQDRGLERGIVVLGNDQNTHRVGLCSR